MPASDQTPSAEGAAPETAIDRAAATGEAVSGGREQAPAQTEQVVERARGAPEEAAPVTQLPGWTHKGKARWPLLAAGSALVLIVLTAAAVLLIMRPTSTVDQLVILTVPSGADITFDSQQLGRSPVKLEGIRIGQHRLVIAKDGFEPIDEEVFIQEPRTLDFKLKVVPPQGAAGLTNEELIEQYRQKAEEAFARGDYIEPFDSSALYFDEAILNLDESNQFALDLRESLRKELHVLGQAAIARGDLGQAQELYGVLVDYYRNDEQARAGQARVESLLAARRGDVRDLARKAEEALKAGNLVPPARSSAYYFAKQALAIDRQNAQARGVYNQVKETLGGRIDESAKRGDTAAATEQLEKLIRLYPEDKQLRARLREMKDSAGGEQARAGEASDRRVKGLDSYTRNEFIQAIPDLEFAAEHDRAGPDVLFALGRSYLKLHQLDKAAGYLRQVPASAGEAYCSSIAALGDVAAERGDTARALERYTEARGLGGSPLYSVETLDDKIERIEKRTRAKAAEPAPLSIQVKHLHGGLLHGSCSGSLTVNSTGVRYSGGADADNFAFNLVSVSVRVNKDELSIRSQNKTEKFKAASPEEAEKFYEAITRYQSSNTPDASHIK